METKFVTLEMGEMFKEIRKKKKLRILDVEADTNLGHSTLYEIEKGSKRVKVETLRTLCDYYGIDFPEEEQDMTEPLTLDEMMTLIELRLHHSTQDAWEGFRQYEAFFQYRHGKRPELAVYHLFFKAKIEEYQERHLDAIEYYTRTLQELEHAPEMIATNLHSASYYGMSKAFHRLSRFTEALEAIEKGLQWFQPSGQRSHFFYLLHINQASILEKRNEDYTALQIVESIWNHPEYLLFSDAKLNLYQIRVELLNKLKDYTEAIRYAGEGLTLARLDGNVDRQFELLSSLGDAHAGMGKVPTAIRYYHEACRLEPLLKRKSLAISTHTQLGRIYLREGKLMEAQQSLEHAVEVGKGDEYQLTKALLALGECLTQQDQTKRAISTLEQAWSLSQKLGLDETSRRSLSLLAKMSRDSQSSNYLDYMNSLLDLVLTPQGGNPMIRTIENDPPSG